MNPDLSITCDFCSTEFEPEPDAFIEFEPDVCLEPLPAVMCGGCREPDQEP